MGSSSDRMIELEEERRRKKDALLDAPDMLTGVVERLEGNVIERLEQISESLGETLERFEPAQTVRVFLSHKTIDKPKVVRYKTALQVCGFQPWIDDDEMHAGTHLDAAILNGMRASCAAVFFITPNFANETFLKQEIEYAVQQERECPGQFVIVPMLLDGATQDNVPPLLQRFLAKTAENELDGLLAIIKALPIKPGPPIAK